MGQRQRVVEPEILDSLPADHPDAVASRGDLQVINALMGNFRWLRRQLACQLRPGDRLLELGAGDGTLARFLGVERAAFPGIYRGLDLAPRPADWPEGLGWVQADVFGESGVREVAAADVVMANLFLHHFSDEALAGLGRAVGRARVLIFSEPARGDLPIWQGRLLAALVPLNHVTRHDLAVSVRAGFCGDELAAALQLDRGRWRWQAHRTVMGAHRFVAFAIGPLASADQWDR